MSEYPQDTIFEVHYLEDHTPSGVVQRFAIFNTPPNLYKMLPTGRAILPNDPGTFKHFEFTFKRKKFQVTFHEGKAT